VQQLMPRKVGRTAGRKGVKPASVPSHHHTSLPLLPAAELARGTRGDQSRLASEGPASSKKTTADLRSEPRSDSCGSHWPLHYSALEPSCVRGLQRALKRGFVIVALS
jgi:hypothetical protein